MHRTATHPAPSGLLERGSSSILLACLAAALVLAWTPVAAAFAGAAPLAQETPHAAEPTDAPVRPGAPAPADAPPVAAGASRAAGQETPPAAREGAGGGAAAQEAKAGEAAKQEKEDAPGETKEGGKSRLNAKTLAGLSWRSIGPALMSGRVADIAIDPVEPNTWYVAVGSGNLWKTTNAGTTWKPIFDDQGSYSIGCVTLDPSNHHTVWVGTGEAVGGRHVGFGDGVYVSRDGGASWKKRGLEDSQHIARILVDPRDSRHVYVAAQGPLWSPGGERGLFETSDGGETWTNLLSGGPYTGVTDVVADPRDPRVLYAATHQHHRTVAALLNGGPETAIHKSTDGGKTWRKLTKGLPSGDAGKIGLAVSPQHPDVVYATIELPGRKGGFWRSEDGGEGWAKRSDFISGGTGPHYYQEIWADPYRFDVIYQANVRLARSEDGGKTWHSIGNGNKHVDNHAVAFHPKDPNQLLVGCDGGLYRSFDRGKTYAFVANLPVTQFYKVDVDYDEPVYHIVGGTQDNNTQYGPAWTMTRNGIRNADWRITIGGDGHDCAIDPTNPDVIYCESQEGYLRRFDRKTGQSLDIRPRPGKDEEDFRFNWDSPILISPHDPARIYYAADRVFRSDDRGESWTAISGDLTRGLMRLTMPMMDRVWSVDATWDLYAMSMFGTITSLAESPLAEGLLYAGTDDGWIQVTEDGGTTWRRIEKIYGIPEFAFVNDVKADRFDADTVYAVLDNHKAGDFQPYVVKSVDRGRTWTSIVGDLPDRHLCWRIEQDHVRPDLLFLGTEFGVFVTLDGGGKWTKLKGGMPVIPVRDLAIQRRENDLVAATFGRSFYVLDDYSPLREITASGLAEDAFHLFPVRKALRYVPDNVLGGRVGSQGDATFSAENRPFGAVFTYFLGKAMKTGKKLRQDEEKKIAKEGGDTPFPGWEALEAEDREVEPLLFFEIRRGGAGAAGEEGRGPVVDRIPAKNAEGIQRVVWDLRQAPFTTSLSGRGAGGGGPEAARGPRGPLVAPGTYTVQAFRREGDETKPLGEPRSFEVVSVGTPGLPAQDPEAILAFQEEAGALQREIQAAGRVLDDALEQVREAQALAREGRKVDLALGDEARALERRLLDARKVLSGSDTKTRRGETDRPSIAARAGAALRGTMNQTHGPTQTHRRQLEIAREEFDALAKTLHELIDRDLEGLREKLDAAGAPWTRGRGVPGRAVLTRRQESSSRHS